MLGDSFEPQSRFSFLGSGRTPPPQGSEGSEKPRAQRVNAFQVVIFIRTCVFSGMVSDYMCWDGGGVPEFKTRGGGKLLYGGGGALHGRSKVG